MPALYDYGRAGPRRISVHRLLYTDPAVFARRDGQHASARHVGPSRAMRARFQTRTISSPASSGLRRLIITRDEPASPQRLYNRCTHRGTTLCRLGRRATAVRSRLPLSRLEFPQHRQAARAAPRPDGYAVELVQEDKFNLAQVPRVEILSRLHLRHAQHGCAAAHRPSRADQEAGRRVARSQPGRQGHRLRGEPAQIQGQLEARLPTIRATATTSCSRTAR